MRLRIWVTVSAIVSATIAPLPASFATADSPPPERRGDYNGDGYHDLAVGVPFEDVDGDDDAGAVQVIYGTQQGLNGDAPIDDQFLTQGTLSGSVEPGDRFGHALAWGDLDADGFDDLAIGAPFEDVQVTAGNIEDAGVVHVAYGSPSGLTAFGDVVLSQNAAGIVGEVAVGDRFGFALATGNLGAGAGDELAIGVPRDRVGSVARAGAVNVLYGGAAGVGSGGNQLWHQDVAGISGVAETSDEFGTTLTIGNFGGSARADLAVGVPLEDLDPATQADAGSVNVIYGGRNGLTSSGNHLWHQNSADISGTAETGDRFGAALAAGDFGRDSMEDLAVGVPREDAGGTDAGVAQVLYGTSTGLTASGNQLWYLNSSGVPGAAAQGDALGFALAAGDMGRDARDDLAIGVPLAFHDENDAGRVIVVYGSATGLSSAGVQSWTQGSSGIAGAPENPDAFGSALAVADFGHGPESDLAVGVPGEFFEDTFPVLELIPRLGAVNVIYATPDGLDDPGDQFWWQRSDALKDSGEDEDRFGWSLA